MLPHLAVKQTESVNIYRMRLWSSQQQLLVFVYGNRTGVKISLCLITADGTKEFYLLISLDALGDYLHPQPLCHADDGI